MAMLRHRARAGSHVPTRLLFSSRHAETRSSTATSSTGWPAATTGSQVVHTLTRSQPPGWTGYARRIDARCWPRSLEPLGAAARAYVCGPTALVETVANGLVRLGLPPDRIRTERFGPTGT